MKKDLFLLNQKKGVSLMVGYVLLIALAIGLSVGVFFYLKLYLPSEKPVCPEGITITIDEVDCRIAGAGSAVSINLTNRGLFTVDSAYIKIGEDTRVFRELLNDPDDRLGSVCNSLSLGLKPGEKYCKRDFYYSSENNTAIHEISVEPLLYINNIPTLCPNSIAVKKINCS